MSQTVQDLVKTYQALGIQEGQTVMVRSDLLRLGRSRNPRELLAMHFDALCKSVNLNRGTVVMPSASYSLCNTDRVYDPATTKSEVGVLSEFFRKRAEIRSLHPFTSYSALGKNAKAICQNVSQHSYGLCSPKARLIDADAQFISIGLLPQRSCTVVHHIEFMAGVPYRYTKEFEHSVLIESEIKKMFFYMYVWYRNMQFERDGNLKIIEAYLNGGGEIHKQSFGAGHLYKYSLKQFYSIVSEAFAYDPYIWLKLPPEASRPYQL